jgi:DNA-binding transcriptional ArsR family regulator
MPKRNGQGIELLADPTRRAIVALLALGAANPRVGQPSKIAKEIGRSRPATSRQLRLLRKAGLISVRKHFVDGRRVVYYIDPRRHGQITAWLAGTEVGRAFPPTPRDELTDPSDDVA